jgi:iron complex outermembrane receptor protein
MPRILAAIPLCLLAPIASAEAEEAPQQLEEVVVSAPLDRTGEQLARPVTVLKGEELRLRVEPTIGGTLQQEPGVNSQSFGPGVGMPVIRGQTGPRVRVMQNGIGNNDVSNFSPDHANSVEPIQAERIEVLRGPATLLYGSGAIGGVVNVIDNRIPERMPDHALGGALEQRYDSALDETSSALKLEGGAGSVAFHLDGFYRDSGNMKVGGWAIDEAAARAADPVLAETETIQNTRGYVPNTHARARGGTAGLSWVGEPGFAGVSVNRLENNYGIPPDGTGGEPVRVDLRQTKYDFRGALNQPFEFAEALRLKFGYTDYRHVELEGGTPGTTWLNQAYESRLEMTHKPLGPLRGMVGFQSVHSDFAAFGEEAVVPQSNIDTYGLFAVESLDVGAVTYELGARVEHQSISPRGGRTRGDLPVSGSASALWKIDDSHQLGLAFTQSQRAPQVQELYTNGVHHATRSFEIGDPNLKKEISYNLDLGYRFKRDWMQAEFSLFHNWVNDYIYQQNTGELYEGEEREEGHEEEHPHGEGLPILRTSQADAIFRGFEAKLLFPLMENRHGLVDLTLFSDYTCGEFVNGGDVPRMPPLRYGLQLDYVKNGWSANLRLTRGERQDDAGENESETPGYVLLNVGVQYEAKAFEDARLLVFARGNNLLDENIRNSTSYLRNFAPEPGRGAEVGIRISY